MARIVARCSEDKAFRLRLMADPEKTLRTEGADIPKGVTVKVEEDGGQVRLVFSENPKGLSDGELRSITPGCAEYGLGSQWKGLDAILHRVASTGEKSGRRKGGDGTH